MGFQEPRTMRAREDGLRRTSPVGTGSICIPHERHSAATVKSVASGDRFASAAGVPREARPALLRAHGRGGSSEPWWPPSASRWSRFEMPSNPSVASETGVAAGAGSCFGCDCPFAAVQERLQVDRQSGGQPKLRRRRCWIARRRQRPTASRPRWNCSDVLPAACARRR